SDWPAKAIASLRIFVNAKPMTAGDGRPLFMRLAPGPTHADGSTSLSVRRMLRLRPLLLLAPDRHLVEEGRQPVHVPQEIRVQRLPTGQRDDPALGAACDRAGPMQPYEALGTARQDELGDSAYVERVDPGLETGHVLRDDPRNLLPLPGAGHRQFGAHGEEVVLDLQERITDLLFLQGRDRETEDGVQFIDGAHRL